MQLKRNSEIEIDLWKEIIHKSPYASPFQTREFYQFLNSIEGYSADVFAIVHKNEIQALAVIALLQEKGLRSKFSRRGIIYGGILVNNSNEKAVELLLQKINNFYIKKLIYLEVRNNFDYSKWRSIFKNNNYAFQEHLNVQIIANKIRYSDVLLNMKYNRRREINMSIKEGAIVKEVQDIVEIEDIYIILKDLYKNKVKLPLPELEYFVKLFKSNFGKVFAVIHENKVIGGSFCLFMPNKSIFTLYYAGIRDYHKKIYPTHLAVIGAINFAEENGLEIVDFMGAGKPNEVYGVRDYKLQFGGALVEHGRFLNILNPGLYNVGKLGLKILSKL